MKEEMRAKTFAHLVGIDKEIEIVCRLAGHLIQSTDPLRAARAILEQQTGLKVSNWTNYEKRYPYSQRTCEGTVEEG